MILFVHAPFLDLRALPMCGCRVLMQPQSGKKIGKPLNRANHQGIPHTQILTIKKMNSQPKRKTEKILIETMKGTPPNGGLQIYQKRLDVPFPNWFLTF